MGGDYWKDAFQPLLPEVYSYDYGSHQLLDAITEATAAVFVETIQGEAGVIIAAQQWMTALRQKCSDSGTLLVLDEIQCGMGRTGTLWAFQHYGIVPDVLLLGKALGGGMPLGAFIAGREVMKTLSYDPVLGHTTTFGGHPVSCAAGMAGFQELVDSDIIQYVTAKATLFKSLLIHPRIKDVRSAGLLIAVELESDHAVREVLKQLIQRGIFSDWFLFAPHCLRIAPPLVITDEEIQAACKTIVELL